MAESKRVEVYSGDESEWRQRLQDVWAGVRRVTQIGLEKSEKFSKVTRHQVKRKILVRNRGKLFQELGEMAFHLIQSGKIEHDDLKRAFERIGAINVAIQEETETIGRLQRGELPPPESP